MPLLHLARALGSEPHSGQGEHCGGWQLMPAETRVVPFLAGWKRIPPTWCVTDGAEWGYRVLNVDIAILCSFSRSLSLDCLPDMAGCSSLKLFAYDCSVWLCLSSDLAGYSAFQWSGLCRYSSLSLRLRHTPMCWPKCWPKCVCFCVVYPCYWSWLLAHPYFSLYNSPMGYSHHSSRCSSGCQKEACNR